MYVYMFVCMHVLLLFIACSFAACPLTPRLNRSPSLPLAKLTSFSSNKCQVSRCIAASLHSLGVCASVCLCRMVCANVCASVRGLCRHLMCSDIAASNIVLSSVSADALWRLFYYFQISAEFSLPIFLHTTPSLAPLPLSNLSSLAPLLTFLAVVWCLVTC